MYENGLKSEITLDETPNFKATEERPLNKENNQTKKVDINVLKARVQQIESREKKKICLSLFLSWLFLRWLEFTFQYK